MATKINLRSPFYIKAQDSDLASATLNLYIYTGTLNTGKPATAQYTITKSEISTNNYVIFEIAELVRDYLDIEFDAEYNSQCVWVYYELDIINSAGTTLFSDADLLLGVDGYGYFEEGAFAQTNLLSGIDQLNDTNYWTKQNNIAVVENDDDTFITGEIKATQLGATTSTFASNAIQSQSINTSGKKTFSIYAKRENADFVVLQYLKGTSQPSFQFFDLLNGKTGTSFSFSTNFLDARIYDYGNDWYKCEVDFDVDGSDTAKFSIYVARADNDFDTKFFDTIIVFNPRLEDVKKYINRDTLLQSNKTVFRLNDYNVRVPIYTENTTSIAYRYQGETKRSQTISSSVNTNGQIDYVTASGNDNVDTYEQRVLADGGILEQSPLLDEFLDTTDIGIVDELYVSSDKRTDIIKIKTFECSKYEPIKVTFVNKFGALQDIFFTLKSTESLNTTGETYKANVMNFNALTYDTYKPQVAQYNKMGKESITLNTDYISEEYNEVIKQLMMSEQVWLTKLTDEQLVLPIIPKTQSVTYKTSLNDRLVQYTIDFDYAFDKINTVR